MTDFEQVLSRLERKPPIFGNIQIDEISSMPERPKFDSDLAWVCANLKNVIISTQLSENGRYDLIPISPYDLKSGFLFRLFEAWNREDLRRGYLPILPRKINNISEVLQNWLNAPYSVIYRVLHSDYINTTGFIKLELSLPESGLEAGISYGNLSSDFQRMHHLTNGVGILINALKEETPTLGFPLRYINTSVSDLNIGSIKVLINNGFKFDSSRETTPSPIVLGGTSFPMILELTS